MGITTSVTTNYFGFRTTAPASGSGFILTEHGYVITNYHVVEDGSNIKVTTYDNATYKAELVGYDKSSDPAVLKIEADGLTPVILGDSDQMNVGDSVVAIGNPLGELTFSLTSGSVSALNREITINNTAMDLIQTDCAINSGNSGGALFDMYGEASIDNIGFAIPINSVRSTIQSIVEDGTITKPYIGVSLTDLGYEFQRFGLAGAVVQSVAEGSPAEEAGLQLNDIITKINGKEISSTSEIRNCLSGAADGEIVSLTVYR